MSCPAVAGPAGRGGNLAPGFFVVPSKTAMNLRAVFPPMPTPFADGEVDIGAIRNNIQRWMTAGLGGVLILGTNGEAPLLDEDEADRVIETARQVVPRERTLLTGVGRESTKHTIAAARRAATLGADAVVVRTPSFYRAHTPSAALMAHYTAVADASPAPVVLYNYPAFTGVNLTPDLVGRLAEHRNVVGIKETSTDGAQFAELAALVPDGFTILSGSAPGCFAALCAGARGAILAVACVAPAACLELVELTLAGRLAEALACQQRLTPLARAVTTVFGIAGLKAALDLAGYRGGDPRPPLRPLSGEGIDTIRTLLETVRTAPISS
jgi:4-hydroxy-2-oxoglutarate aldolase